MSLFNNQRLTNATLSLDLNGLRLGDYSDRYFENVVTILNGMLVEGYTFGGQPLASVPTAAARATRPAEMRVEMQVFNRHAPRTLVAGVDAALVMLRHACGYYHDNTFVETWDRLEVEAIEDGDFTHYNGDPAAVQPVMKIRGAYRDFALLETAILGYLSRGARVATNVYQVLEVSNGKPVSFFPARFDLPSVQALDGYAYWLAVQRYNQDYDQQMPPSVSTTAQAAWWGGRSSGTTPHALIATFFGDTAEAMLAFARHLPLDVPRMALVDFNNDCVNTALAVLDAFWPHYRAAVEANDNDGQLRWALGGVRLDTSANMRDASLTETDPKGVNPVLVRAVRAALDRAWERWHVPQGLVTVAQLFCQGVKIVVTGGFNREKISRFEAEGVPVDIYGVGSTMLRNDSDSNTDHTMDIVRAEVDGAWVRVAKVGRQANDNPTLRPVDLRGL
jgi:nicotinate phosphoribosyltransferase